MSERTRSTDGASTVESLTDPESLRDREGVAFSEETEVLDREAFETVREHAETTDGVVLVGITNDEGQILLKNTCTGWVPPGGNVDPGEDWTAVARREAESWTGRTVEIDGVDRVRRIDHRLDGGESAGIAEVGEKQGDERPISVYAVYVRASLAAGETITDEPGAAGADEPDLGWFGELPEGVDEDWADDVRPFFG